MSLYGWASPLALLPLPLEKPVLGDLLVPNKWETCGGQLLQLTRDLQVEAGLPQLPA